MNEHTIEILLVEDNPNDEMLAMHAFKKHNLANGIPDRPNRANS
jgi:hypothetical protein